MFKFELHQVVEDTVTGFTGVILARSEDATGYVQYGIVPQTVKSNGSLPKMEWLNDARLKPIIN